MLCNNGRPCLDSRGISSWFVFGDLEIMDMGFLLEVPLCLEGFNVLVKVDSSVGKLAEGSSLLELSGLLGVLQDYHRQHLS